MVGNVLNVKVLREIKNNFKTYLSVILIAALAVTLFTGILANYQNFNDRLEHIYQEANMCDGIVMTKNRNEELEAYLEEKDIFFEKRIYIPTKSGNENIYLVTFDQTSTLNRPFRTSIEGDITEDMVLVDSNFLKRNQLEIGDTFAAALPLYNLTITLKISGIMTHPESLENSTYNPSFIQVGYQALKSSILDAFHQPFITEELVDNFLIGANNQYLIRGEEAVFSSIKDKFEDRDNFVYSLKRSELPSNMTVDADVTQAKQLIYIFPVIFYLVAVLIILTSISQLIHRESKNIGILKALGFSKGEILFHYMKIFMVLGLLGSILGMILGPLIVPTVMGKKYNILYQLPEISLPFFRVEYLISVGILLVITALTSIFACYEAMNQVPASSLRGENSVRMKVSFLNRFSFMKKIPLSILMAFRNMKRKISRTLMVVLGVLGCSALLVCGFGIEDTINYGVGLELDHLIPYDVSVTYQNSKSIEEQVKNLEGVALVDEYAKYSVNVSKDHLISSYLFLLPEEAKVFTPSYGREDCIISSKVAEEINAQLGDEISFIFQNQTYAVKVTSIQDFCISQGVFLSRAFTDAIEFHPTGAWIKTTNAELNDQVAEEITSIDGVLSTLTISQMRERAEDVISSIKVMTWTIKIFAILLAIVVLYNLALLNFKERTKDIATLKVLGFSKFEVAASFIIEIITLTFLGALVGLCFGYPLLVAVLSINENPLLSYIYHINPISYGLTILITCGTSLFINLFFAFLTNKVQMVESLKSVE